MKMKDKEFVKIKTVAPVREGSGRPSAGWSEGETSPSLPFYAYDNMDGISVNILNQGAIADMTGSGSENALTVRENGKRVVYLNGYSDNMTREEKLKLGIKLGHEAYRDGVVSDTATQMIETRNAVAGHTDMMTRMLGDSLYSYTFSGIIAGDTNLQMDLLARSLGDDVFNDYVDGMYDSSADYWRMTCSGQLLSDGDGWLKDMNGEFILDENGNKIGADKQESGLLNIMAGTGGQKYDSFSEEQKIQAQEIMNNAGLSMDKNGQWNTLSGKKLDMTQIMSISGDTIAASVFNQYYNNKVDYDLAGAWGLDLRFGETAMNKTVPDIAQERYSELVSTHLEETGTPAALMNKYTWSIYDSNGVATQLYKIDENNSFLDDLLKQTDSGLDSVINNSGCNFMSTLAFPQLLTGNVLDASEIQSIWDYSTKHTFVNQYGETKNWIDSTDSNVNNPDKVANYTFNKLGYSNLELRYGWSGNNFELIGNKVQVPYSNTGHWLLSDKYLKYLYNPANKTGKVNSYNPVYLRKN